MALADSECLAELNALDSSLLYLFVAGPGEGEGVAVALPGGGWLLVDGCQTVNRSDPKYPLEELYKRYRRSTDRVELMVLTHPHRDHTYGFAELLETLAPARVGVLGLENPRWLLAEEGAMLQAEARRDSPLKLASKRAHAVLRSIETYASHGSLIGLVDGVQAFTREDVSVHVRAPDADQIRKKLEQGRAKDLLGESANAFSLVLEVEHTRSTILLGGDLPRVAKGGTVPTGWDLVMSRHDHLVYHSGLKVPHHGSREALHPDLVDRMENKDRAWCVAPYNSSALPRLDTDGGMDVLLQGQSPVMLTALPVPAGSQLGGLVVKRREEIERLVSAEKRAALPGSSVHRVPRLLNPLDPIWAVAFDADGHIRGRWRGDCALDVIE